MKTQVLIPAKNEGQRLSVLLERLPRHQVEPIVAVNGSEDDTAEVARRYTDRVFEFEASGKLPAIQSTLKQLGERALEPMMLIDADTVPLLPEAWHRIGLRALTSNNHPVMMSAPVIFRQNKAGRMAPLVRSAFRYVQTASTRSEVRHTGVGGAQYGPNMGMRLFSKLALDTVVELPNIWPEMDVAHTQVVMESHPLATFEQLIHPFASALTPEPAAMQPISEWIKNSASAHEATRRAYRESGPEGTTTYQEWISTRNNVI